MSLIEPPAGMNRHPHAIHCLERNPESTNCSFEYRRVSDINLKARVPKTAPCCQRLSAAAVSQIYIRPAREPVISVPFAFAVSQKYESGHPMLLHKLRTGQDDSRTIAFTCVRKLPRRLFA